MAMPGELRVLFRRIDKRSCLRHSRQTIYSAKYTENSCNELLLLSQPASQVHINGRRHESLMVLIFNWSNFCRLFQLLDSESLGNDGTCSPVHQPFIFGLLKLI